MKRAIIHIDAEKCNGCELCLPHCPEGALQMIDGKARLISDLFCDGLGACLGHCPEGAITIEERQAEPYDEIKVMANVVTQGPNVIKAHLDHLREHQETELLRQALSYLKSHSIPFPADYAARPASRPAQAQHFGCPGSRSVQLAPPSVGHEKADTGHRPSQLTHWPIQLHLLSPYAPHFGGAEVLLAADCTAFAAGDFHKDFLGGKKLAIACPKLDVHQDVYVEKIQALIDESRIESLTIVVMQVPCCHGLLRVAQRGRQLAARKVPMKSVILDLQGNVIAEETVEG